MNSTHRNSFRLDQKSLLFVLLYFYAIKSTPLFFSGKKQAGKNSPGLTFFKPYLYPVSQYNYYIIYKPYGMLSQFTAEGNKPGLGSLFKFPIDCYPVGRLDADSEGLLLLTNDKKINQKLLDPKAGHKRTYLVQVDGAVTEEAVEKLRKGVEIRVEGKTFRTLPALAEIIEEPALAPRNPPVRFRKSIPTSWISLSLTEGKNRQVRHMTAAVGFPTLRIVRIAMEKIKLGEMKPGDVLEMTGSDVYDKLFGKTN
jgi:23S rRNA pseudouridine2457 synthase